MAIVAKGTVQLAGEDAPREHEFFIADDFGGDLGKAVAHIKNTHKGIINVRASFTGPATLASEKRPEVIAPKA